MKPVSNIPRRKLESDPPAGLAEILTQKLIGQQDAIDAIVPYVQVFQAALSPEGRPAAVFLLLGPTGTGKTRTVEALAEALHGTSRSMVKVDCGEFQMEHEVAKLLGAPPGYLGHRETPPMLSQAKLNAAASDKCGLSIVLFDEVEKAAASVTRLLLGVLDKATLRLGDNTTVNFEKTVIFLTSNLGARAMNRETAPGFGFAKSADAPKTNIKRKLAAIGAGAAKRKFPPEFLNRVDRVITYQPLDEAAMARILEIELGSIQRHLNIRLGVRTFTVALSPRGRKALLEQATSPEFGAREIRRTLHRRLLQPVAALVTQGAVFPASTVELDYDGNKREFRLAVSDSREEAPGSRAA